MRTGSRRNDAVFPAGHVGRYTHLADIGYYSQSVSQPTTAPTCRRCGLAVEYSRESYDVFEGMHYVCFHYEFEHEGDPDVGCFAMGCPSSSLGGAFSYGSLPMSSEGRTEWKRRFGREPDE